MAQLPCIGLSWPLTKPPFGSCAIFFHYGVNYSWLLLKGRHFPTIDKVESLSTLFGFALHGTNISHLWKRNIIFTSAFKKGDMWQYPKKGEFHHILPNQHQIGSIFRMKMLVGEGFPFGCCRIPPQQKKTNKKQNDIHKSIPSNADA